MEEKTRPVIASVYELLEKLYCGPGTGKVTARLSAWNPNIGVLVWLDGGSEATYHTVPYAVFSEALYKGLIQFKNQDKIDPFRTIPHSGSCELTREGLRWHLCSHSIADNWVLGSA